MTTKTRNDVNFTRSATAPDTIEAAVATNTIWKNQSEPDEYPSSTDGSDGFHKANVPI